MSDDLFGELEGKYGNPSPSAVADLWRKDWEHLPPNIKDDFHAKLKQYAAKQQPALDPEDTYRWAKTKMPAERMAEALAFPGKESAFDILDKPAGDVDLFAAAPADTCEADVVNRTSKALEWPVPASDVTARNAMRDAIFTEFVVHYYTDDVVSKFEEFKRLATLAADYMYSK